jgi:hypothetical protein
MPIEDVEYLIDNSAQESSMVFIDSSKRDRRFFPTPSEYHIEFEEPMRSVFGMDVLDATIPGTMYNVDVHNNSMIVIAVDSTRSANLVRAGGTDAAETAALQADFYSMGFSVQLKALMAASKLKTGIVVIDGDDFSGTAPSVMGIDSAYPCYLMVRRVVRGVPMTRLSSYDASKPAPPGSALIGNVVYVMTDVTTPGVNVQLAQWLDEEIPDLCVTRSSVAGGSSRFAGASASSELFDLTYYRLYPISPAQRDAFQAGAAPILYSMHLVPVLFQVGNYTVATLLLELQKAMVASCGINIVSTSSGTVEVQGKYRFTTTADIRFLFAVSYSTSGPLLGFDLYADMSVASVDTESRPYNAVLFGTDERPFFMSVRKAAGQQLDAPGLVNLLGLRYITLRCKEIEENMGCIGKYGAFSTGIGVFKLASASELAQLRFDFVSLIRKPFHPIGKLTRMTLRFERSDGTLYDFKGINHQLLITIKYYVPAKKDRFVSTVLNPDYDPDFHRYVARQAIEAARLDDKGMEDDESDTHGSDAGEDGGGIDTRGGGEIDESTRRRIMLEQYKNAFLEEHDLSIF